MTALASLGSLAGGALGAAMLRRAWRQRGGENRIILIGGGWAVLLATLVAIAFAIGPVKGTAIAIGFEGLAALVVVALGRIYRPSREPRPGEVAPEPLEGQGRGRFARGLLKTLLAGPLGLVAAIGLAFCYATWMPGDPRTRIVIGGLFVPVLWGLAMTWTLADQRLIRSTAVLAGTALVSFSLAALKGLA